MTQDRRHIVAAEIRANTAQFRRELSQASRGVDALARRTERASRRMGSSWARAGARLKHMRQQITSGGVMARGGGMVRGALGMAGVFGFQQAVIDAKEFEETLADLMITGNKSTKWMNAVRKQVLDLSAATGKSKTEVASYLKAIIDQTGNADMATESLSAMGDAAVATGAHMGDLGAVMVKFGSALRISAKDSYKAMNTLRYQTIQGSMTMADVSRYIGQPASLAPAFGKSAQGLAGVRAIGGLLQMSMRGHARDQPGMAATAAARFLGRLSRNPAKIEKELGIKIQDPNGKFLALPEIYRRIGEAGAKNTKKFAAKGTELFGIQGYKVAQQLQAAAQAGWSKKFGIYSSAASLFAAPKEDILARDKAKRIATPAHAWNQAMADMAATMHRTMLPVLRQAAKALPDLAKALKFVLEHSEALVRLWLSTKAVMMFRRMAGPMGAGGQAGMAMGPGGIGGGMAWGGGGGGWAGPARRGRPHMSRNLGTWLNPRYAPGQFGSGNFGRSGASDLALLRRERWYRSRGRLAMGARSLWRQHGRGMAGGAGMVAGAASFFGPQFGPSWANQAAAMGMMSGSPYLMAAGAAYKGSSIFRGYGSNLGSGPSWTDVIGGGAISTAKAAWDYYKGRRKRGALGGALDLAAKTGSTAWIRSAAAAKGYQGAMGSYRGMQVRQSIIDTLSGLGLSRSGSTKTGDYSIKGDLSEQLYQLGETKFAKKKSTLESGYQAMRAAAAAAARKAGVTGPLSEEQLNKFSGGQLTHLKQVIDKMDGLLAKLLKDGVHATVTVNTSADPADRLSKTTGIQPWFGLPVGG